MRISIITPSYNQGDYIEETIRSILHQKGDFEIEHIVMDGASTDQTIDILTKYSNDKRCCYVSEPDRGHTHAINKGIKKATGDIVAYLNSDDVYLPGTFQKVAEYFKKHPDKNWGYGKCRIINEKGREIRKWITWYKNFLMRRYSYNKLLIENFVCQPATFWRRCVTDEIGYLDEQQNLVMDYEYWLRIGEKYDAGFINEYLAGFRWYRESKSGAQFKNQFREELIVAERHAKKKWPIWLHTLNYYKIVGIYTVMRWMRV